MDLYRLKDKKRLDWPHELTPVSPEIRERNTRRGLEWYRIRNKVARSEESGFVVDMDSPGERFFCRDEVARLDPVPAGEREEAVKRLKAQGPIDFQPALDWLEEKGLERVQARPEEVQPKREAGDGEPELVPLAKMKSADLKELCDALGLPHGKVGEMREAIAEKAECTPEDAVSVTVLDGEGEDTELELVVTEAGDLD